MKADNRKPVVAWPCLLGSDIVKCRVSLKVRCCKRACATGNDSISLFEGSRSDYSHCWPLKTETFSADVSFCTKCLVWWRNPPLAEVPGAAGKTCINQMHHVPGGLGYPNLFSVWDTHDVPQGLYWIICMVNLYPQLHRGKQWHPKSQWKQWQIYFFLHHVYMYVWKARLWFCDVYLIRLISACVDCHGVILRINS